MLQESVEWFGVQSTSVPVTVGGLDTSVHFIHVDHLNTPRLVANSSGTTVWRWDQQEPFGVNVPDENPSSLGAFEFPLRFPGQYADKETNLFYNYSRHYDASTGRYDESDLIGLGGGVNTYGYVGGDPLSNTDPFGLCDFDDLICQAAVGQMPISGLRSPCDQDCFNAFFGISTIAAAGTALSGTPSVPKRFATPGSSPATSVASQTASKVFGQAQLPTRLPAPTAANPGAMTNSVARFTGRWVPIAGFGVLMYNFYALGKCLNQCNPMFCPK
jgi:RHS repeat-associated protein